jgi:mRNA interferase RelE/StbE
MKRYNIEVSATAERQMKKLPREDQIRIARAILHLAENPHPPGYRKLTGYEDVFRIRVGMYRVIFSVDPGKIIVIILKVGHRKNVYR